MNKYTLYEFVKEIIGETYAIGDSYTDKERYQNLVIQCGLIDDLIQEVIEEVGNLKTHRHSMFASGKYAYDYLTDLKEDLDNVLEEYKVDE